MSVIIVLHLAMTLAVVKLANDVTKCDASHQTPDEIARLKDLASE